MVVDRHRNTSFHWGGYRHPLPVQVMKRRPSPPRRITRIEKRNATLKRNRAARLAYRASHTRKPTKSELRKKRPPKRMTNEERVQRAERDSAAIQGTSPQVLVKIGVHQGRNSSIAVVFKIEGPYCFFIARGPSRMIDVFSRSHDEFRLLFPFHFTDYPVAHAARILHDSIRNGHSASVEAANQIAALSLNPS